MFQASIHKPQKEQGKKGTRTQPIKIALDLPLFFYHKTYLAFIPKKKPLANMNKATHDRLFPLIKQKQRGEYCLACQRDPFILSQLGMNPQLVIDHEDNDNTNNDINNLRLLCRSCNTLKNHWRRMPFIEDLEDSPTYKKSKQNEFRFRQYVMGRIQEPESNGYVHWDSLIADGAEHCQCSEQAIKNYLSKMTAPREGIFKRITRQDAQEYISLKERIE